MYRTSLSSVSYPNLLKNYTRARFALAKFAPSRDYLPWFSVVVFIAFLFIRSSNLLTNPRFWAEEAWTYLEQIQGKSFIEGMLVVNLSNYQFLTNLFVFLSTKVSAQYAAHVTTYLSFGVGVYASYLLGIFLLKYNGNYISSLLLVAVFSFQTAGYEVFLSATNVMWVCSVTILVLSCLPLNTMRPKFLVLNLFWVLVCGLTGVTSDIVLPAMLIQGLVRRSKAHLLYSTILMTTSVLQISLIYLSHHTTARPFSFSTLSIIPVVLQTIWVHVIGVDLTDLIGQSLRADTATAIWRALPLCYGAIAWILFCLIVSLPKRTAACVLLFSWIYVTIINVFGSLDGSTGMISGWLGGRYFFFGSTAVMMMLAIGTTTDRSFRRLLSYIVLSLMLLVSVTQRTTASLLFVLLNGPSLESQIKSCNGERPCHIKAWPPEGSPANLEIIQQ